MKRLRNGLVLLKLRRNDIADDPAYTFLPNPLSAISAGFLIFFIYKIFKIVTLV
jgi:hypothetical protein